MGKLQELVDSYLTNASGALAMIISDIDGLPIVYRALGNIDVHAISALSASMINQASKLNSRLRFGDVNRIMVNYANYILYVEHLQGNFIVTTVASSNASMGFIMYVTSKYIERINELMRRSVTHG